MRLEARALAFAAVVACVSLAGAEGAAEPPDGSDSLGPQIMHMPLLERRAEQGILRPVPITVELPDEIGGRARRVLLHYRLWGDPDWTTLALRRTSHDGGDPHTPGPAGHDGGDPHTPGPAGHDGGDPHTPGPAGHDGGDPHTPGPAGARYEGAIPCLEISTVTGDLRYYIRVHDADGRVIASAASLANPYVVTIKHDAMLAAEARQVAKCPDPADCPEGLPGCPSERVTDLPCASDRDCTPGTTCGWRGTCERVRRHRNWITLAVEQGFGVIGGSGACSIYAQENEGFACYRADGAQYVGNPVLTNEPPSGGPAQTRIVAGYERLVFYDTSVGVRLGVSVQGSGPTPPGATPFVPVSASARVTHWFGEDPFARARVRPFVFVTAGYEMVDVPARVHVREDPTRLPVYQGGNDLEQTLHVWRRAGDGSAGAGAGVAFALDQSACPQGPAGSPSSPRRTGTCYGHVAVFGEVAVLVAFPFDALVLAPSAGMMVGF